jgi:hypothetical protein
MPCTIRFEEADVVASLDRMRLPRDIMLGIFEATLGERANVTESDPVTTPGTETWRWGTRFCRDDPQLRQLGWVSCRANQLDGIRNDDLRIKLVVCNTDSFTGIISKTPRNIAGKGAVSCKLIEQNSYQQNLPFIEVETAPDYSGYDFWNFCIHASDRAVAAEISRPDEILGDFIRHFSDRIILCKPGDRPGLRRPGPVPEEFAEIEKPTLIRKN